MKKENFLLDFNTTQKQQTAKERYLMKSIAHCFSETKIKHMNGKYLSPYMDNNF